MRRGLFYLMRRILPGPILRHLIPLIKPIAYLIMVPLRSYSEIVVLLYAILVVWVDRGRPLDEQVSPLYLLTANLGLARRLSCHSIRNASDAQLLHLHSIPLISTCCCLLVKN